MALLDHWKSGTYHTPQKLCWPVSIFFSSLPFYKGKELDQHKTYVMFKRQQLPFQFAVQARLRRKVAR